MNERIRELAEQAELPVIDGMWDYNSREILCRENGEWRAATPTEIISVLLACEKGREKFAELIIKECVEQGKQVQSQTVSNGSKDYNEGREMGIEVFMNQIKKHFGVE